MATVLLVEDDKDLLQIMTKTLSDAGFTVQPFDNGQAALDYIGKHKPDIAVLDIMLPDIDGLTILQEISKSDHLKGMPALILSNLEDPASIEQAAAVSPEYEYLVKSRISLTALVDKLKSKIKS